MSKRINTTLGTLFTRLTVFAPAPDYISKQGLRYRRWWCRCLCGTELIVHQGCLYSGHTKSCGCLNIEKSTARVKTHGFTSGGKRPTEYGTWANIKQRCYNPKNEKFHCYGGRPIADGGPVKFCQRWKASFEDFYSDMGAKPAPKESIDRKDNKGHYSCGKCAECLVNGWPMNCRWVTQSVQTNNSSVTYMIEHNGKTLSITDWSRLTGINKGTIRGRIESYGWAIEKALTTPVRH